MFWPGAYGVATTIYFPLVTAGGTDFQTTWTPAAGETQRSLDGAAFANCTNTPAHEGNGIWSLALSAAEMQATVIAVTLSDGATDIEDQGILVHTGLTHQILALSAVEVYTVNNAITTPLATSFEADRGLGRSEEATADHFKGRNIFWLDPNMQSQATDITAYAQQNSRGFFTVTSMTEAPANGDQFLIL
jgi:hypothetical protein